MHRYSWENGVNVLDFVKRSQVALAAMRRGVEGGSVTADMIEPMVGLYKLNPVVTRSLKAPCFNP